MRVKDLAAATIVSSGDAPPITKKTAPPTRETAPIGTAWHMLAPDPQARPGSSKLLSVMASQNVQAVSPDPPDGAQFVERAILEIRRLKTEAPHVRSVVVFDLDNTLFETRARTLHAMRAFDAQHGTQYFAGLEIDDMGKNGKHTAELAGLPEIAEKVHAFWTEYFWKGENFLLDHVMTKVADLAKEAHEAGAEVVYLTGRVDASSTLTQLIAAGLPNADAEHVVCKPAVGANTGKFKGVYLQDLLDKPDTFVGFFLTEGRRDIATVQAQDPRVPCVRLGYVHEREGHANLPHTPLIPESWSEVRRPLDENR